MKLNRLLLMSVMGLGLFACNNNDLVEGTSGQDGTQSEGTTYVGFTLKFNDANTRATTTETGTAAEQEISSAYVMMTSDGGTTFEEVLSMENTPENGKGEGYYSDQEKFLFQTNAGNHDFYAVINPDEPPVQGGNISAYFKTAIALPLSTITTDDNFMMSSHEIKTFYVNDNVTEQQALNGTANNYTIDVERVAAKVTMTTENTTLTNATNNAGGTISDPFFYLHNIAKKSYRMAQASIFENTEYYNDGISPISVYVKGEQEQTTDLHNNATPTYCLENQHAAGGYKQGNTTYLTLSTTFSPAKVVDPDATLVKPLKPNTLTGSDANKTFYVVKSGELAGNYLMEEDLKEFRGDDLSKTDLPAGVEAISDRYTNGTCWFGPIWIGQEDETSQDAPVIRNTWYNLKITGIELPGDPEEPTINGEEPLVPATNVAITLNILDWDFIDRQITLK